MDKLSKSYKIFGRDLIDGAAIKQFLECMDHDFVVKGSLMPDGHLGYTLAIGGVIATLGYVVPAWVGYDLGCGVCAIRTTFNRKVIEQNKDKIFDLIYKKVPVGFNHHSKPVVHWGHGERPSQWFTDMFDAQNGNCQLGTLGGGNHFIEIAYDMEDNVWIVIHSGSRGIGHKTATHYIKMAHPEGKAKEGTYAFEANSVSGMNYIRDMDACLSFALENRRAIGTLVMYAIQQAGVPGIPASDMSNEGMDFINRNHNHAEVNSDGLWVHRKGATHAEKGMLGIIPGNMLDGSFITMGHGNPDSLCSSSHGAGRTLGRKQAKRTLNSDLFELQMVDITCHAGESNLDEAPGAYKNINEVLEAQSDIMTVASHLKPIINVKG